MVFSACLGLFICAFGAATLLPLQSEALLATLVIRGSLPVVLLVLVASAGNVLGSLVNWLLGRHLQHYRHQRWFPLTERKLLQAQDWYRRAGHWSLLLSWLPLIGDPLTLVAGLMREPLWRFLLLVALAKTVRYTVVTALALGFTGAEGHTG
jgi:membrane protein YqaA with SNARE-associated domain